MIGSNLLDNLDEKPIDTNSTPVDNTSPSPASMPVIEDTPDIDLSVSDKSTADSVSTFSTPNTVKPSNFGSMPKRSVQSNSVYPAVESSLSKGTKKVGFSSKGYGTNSYVDDSKSSTEDPLAIKEGFKMPFNLDVTKAKAFALNFIVPIVSFSVSLLLILTVIIPSFTSLPDLKTELAQKQTLNNTLSKKLSNLERLVDFKKIVDENSTLINNVLVSEEMVPELLSQVDHIAKESNLEVSRLSYSLSQAGSGSLGYPSVDISLGVMGTYDQLVNFLKLVENASRLIDVSTYRYTVGSKDTTSLNINLVLRSPYLFVNSSAVTDDPIDLDVTSQSFLNFVSKIQGLKYYNPNEITIIDTIEETQPENVDVNQEQTIPSAQ